jgi:hypothetical protein
MRNYKSCVVLALVVATMGTSPVRAELSNHYCGCPVGDVTNYIFIIQGNVIGNLNLSMMANDAGTNPFEYAIKAGDPSSPNYNPSFAPFAGGTTTVSATVNGDGNTVVSFSGTEADGITPINFNSSLNGLFLYSPHDHNGLPHAGLDGSKAAPVEGGGPALHILSQGWSNSSMSISNPAPSLTVEVVNPPMSGLVHYAVLFADVTTGGQTVGQWFEVPYTADTSPQLTLNNYTSSAETLSDVGFVLSPTMIPLEELNFGLLPPPGTAGSAFTPLAQYDGSSLNGGNGLGTPGNNPITTAALTPEPSSIILMATGLLVVAGHFGRRSVATWLGWPTPRA